MSLSRSTAGLPRLSPWGRIAIPASLPIVPIELLLSFGLPFSVLALGILIEVIKGPTAAECRVYDKVRAIAWDFMADLDECDDPLQHEAIHASFIAALQELTSVEAMAAMGFATDPKSLVQYRHALKDGCRYVMADAKRKRQNIRIINWFL